MEIIPQRIISLPFDLVTWLYWHSKETILFYLLSATGETEENIKTSLNLSDEQLQWILSYLAKKKLATVELPWKKIPKETYGDKLEKFAHEKLSVVYNNWTELTRSDRTKLIMYFYSKLTWKKLITDSMETAVSKKQDVFPFQSIIEAIWRNQHNSFCIGVNDRKWSWDLSYLSRNETEKSQPMEKSLKRNLDVPVSDSSKELLDMFVKSIPALSYIQTIPCKYENSRHSSNEHLSEEEIRSKQREIKQSLGLDITSL